ncbi:MAG: hypothetical protein JXQ87_07560 [Bacteroidia bacterium]
MKLHSIFIFLILFLFSSLGFSKSISVDEILEKKPVVVSKMQKPMHPSFLLVETAFNQLGFKGDDIKGLEIQLVERVDFCYSGYNESKSFSQSRLNESRLNALKQILPLAFEEYVEWRVFEQNKELDKAQAKLFFHGFIIYYRARPSKDYTANEIKFIDDYLAGKTSKGDLSSTFEEEKEKAEFVITGIKHRRMLEYVSAASWDFCKTHPDKRVTLWNPVYHSGCDGLKSDVSKALKNGKPLHSVHNGHISFSMNKEASISNVAVFDNDIFEDIEAIQNSISNLKGWKIPKKTETDSAYRFILRFNIILGSTEHKINITDIQLYNVMKAIPAILPTYSVFNNSGERDSLFIKFFQRNKELNNVAVVCDVTGSMSPYTAQLLKWQQLQFANNKDQNQVFCFFNDGDTKPQSAKVIGSTGGVYLQKVNSFDEIKSLATKAMMAGSGGDTPENNYEAVIKTVNTFPETKTVIMVADNYAPPRDIELIGQVKRPMKIIVCGAYNGINPAYLNAARKSGTSIHTIEDDINNLQKMSIGEKFTIGDVVYKLTKHGFVRM